MLLCQVDCPARCLALVACGANSQAPAEVAEVAREAAEGIPPYLMGPVVDWLTRAVVTLRDDGIYQEHVSHRSLLQGLQLHARLEPPLRRSDATGEAEDLLERVQRNEEFALSVVDYVLRNIDRAAQTGHWVQYATELETTLAQAGSVWQVVLNEDRTAAQLARREAGPAREAIMALPASSRGHQHLVRSWNRLNAREPDYPGAYREAVRAVEAVAKPVISPANGRTSVGTMLRDLRAKPEKWETTIGSIKEVELMMASVWTSQLDRHGTDDESVPLDVSAQQTDAAFAICLALVRPFVGGHVSLAGNCAA
jgi:hypothetical protein